MAATRELPAIKAVDREIAIAVNQSLRGKTNNTGRVTLNTSTGTTTISTKLCTPESKVILFPESAAGAAELGAGTIYISQRLEGSFLIAHANSGTGGRIFAWLVVGVNV